MMTSLTTVESFYNPNHDERGRFAEGDGGGYATSEGALPALGADDVRVVHLTSADAAQEIAQSGLNYENQGMAQSTSRAWADAKDVQLSTDDPRFAGATAVVFDMPATAWRIHNDIVRSPGIIPPKYLVGIIPPSDKHSALTTARLNLARAVAHTIDHLAAHGETLPAELLAWRGTVDAVPDQFIDVPDGIMVAFYPSPALARKLAIDGGEPPDDLHITLALPGKLSSLSPEQRRRLPVIVRGFAMISRPLTGTVAGVTEFPANEGKKPVVYLIDVPGLTAWRQRLVEILALNGYAVANDHGFVPHMTVKYAAEDEQVKLDAPKVAIKFERVCLMLGGQRKEYALGGNPDVDEAVDVFYNPNHDDKGRFAEGEGGGMSGTPNPRPSWAGDKAIQQDGLTIRDGRFNNEGKWAVENKEGNPGSDWKDTPAEAVVSYHQRERARTEQDIATAKRNESIGRIKSGAYTDADVAALANGSRLVTRSSAEGMLNALGVPGTTRSIRAALGNLGVHGTTGSGSDLLKPSEVVERGIKLLAADKHSADAFARGTGAPGRKRKEVEAVNDYQAELDSEYSEWADDAATQLAEEPDDDKRRELLLALLLLLLARLRKLGAANLPDAVSLALDGVTAPAKYYAQLAKIIESNSNYLADSLIPDIRAKIEAAMAMPEWGAFTETGPLHDWVMGWLLSFASRIASYAGAWWNLYNWSVGTAADDLGGGVKGYLDRQARHCHDCPRYHSEEGEQYSSFEDYLGATGNRLPGDYECGPSCRCWLELTDASGEPMTITADQLYAAGVG